ncbi:hypothetical protein [Alicycliphilus sp. T452]|jgi:hypothetical protein
MRGPRIQAGSNPHKREQVKAINAEIEQSMYLLNKAVEDALAERGSERWVP